MDRDLVLKMLNAGVDINVNNFEGLDVEINIVAKDDNGNRIENTIISPRGAVTHAPQAQDDDDDIATDIQHMATRKHTPSRRDGGGFLSMESVLSIDTTGLSEKQINFVISMFGLDGIPNRSMNQCMQINGIPRGSRANLVQKLKGKVFLMSGEKEIEVDFSRTA